MRNMASARRMESLIQVGAPGEEEVVYLVALRCDGCVILTHHHSDKDCWNGPFRLGRLIDDKRDEIEAFRIK